MQACCQKVSFLCDACVVSLFFSKFAYMNNDITNTGTWSENVILVDADYIDKVAFDLIVNFERMIGRRIPPADMARWIDCVALDGGLREGKSETHVVLIHDKKIRRWTISPRRHTTPSLTARLSMTVLANS